MLLFLISPILGQSELTPMDRTFRAYDCSIPARMQAVLDPSQGFRQRPTALPRTSTFMLLQAAEAIPIRVRSCRMWLSQLPSVCSADETQSMPLLEEQFIHFSAKVRISKCQAWWEKRYVSTIVPPGQARPRWALQVNRTSRVLWRRNNGDVRYPSNSTGSLRAWCHGSLYKPRSPVATPRDDVILRQWAEIQLQEEEGMLQLDGPLTPRSQGVPLPCPAGNGHCITPDQVTYFWDLPPEAAGGCSLYQRRMVSGRVLPQGYGPPKFLSTDGSTLLLEVRPSLTRCQMPVHPTNEAGLFLSPDVFFAPFQRPFPYPVGKTPVPLIENHTWHLPVLTAWQHSQEGRQAQANQDYQSDLDLQRIRGLMEGVPGTDGETTSLGRGWFATRSGETAYQYRCRPLLVLGLAPGPCYEALPVRLPQRDLLRRAHLYQTPVEQMLRIPYFLEPRSHRLLTRAGPRPCSPVLPPLYQNQDGRWVAYLGSSLVLVPDPVPWDWYQHSKPSLPPAETALLGRSQQALLEAQSLEELTQVPRRAQQLAHILANQRTSFSLDGGPLAASDLFHELPSAKDLDRLHRARPIAEWMCWAGPYLYPVVFLFYLLTFILWIIRVINRYGARPANENRARRLLFAVVHIPNRRPTQPAASGSTPVEDCSRCRCSPGPRPASPTHPHPRTTLLPSSQEMAEGPPYVIRPFYTFPNSSDTAPAIPAAGPQRCSTILEEDVAQEGEM